jgi:hypothetical protein
VQKTYLEHINQVCGNTELGKSKKDFLCGMKAADQHSVKDDESKQKIFVHFALARNSFALGGTAFKINRKPAFVDSLHELKTPIL